MQSKNYKNGYALLELLFYISLFAVFSVVVINSMVTMSRAYKETTIEAEFVQGATILERISREVRGSSDSTTSAGDLMLTTTLGTVEFLLSGTNVQLIENSTVTGNLNTSKVVVTALSFASITTAEGKAVKISLTIRTSNDPQGRTESFYDTVVLRGAYE